MIKWIKCSDRLPPPYEQILLYCKYNTAVPVKIGTRIGVLPYAPIDPLNFIVRGEVISLFINQTYWAELNLPEES